MYTSGMKKINFPHAGVFVSVIGFSVLFAGCNTVANQVKDKVEETVKKVETAILSEQDLMGISDPLVRKHFVAQANARAYKIVTSSGETKEVSTTQIQIQGDQVKFYTKMGVAGMNTEMIVIGDTTYVKDQKDNSWWKQVVKPESQESNQASLKVPKLDELKAEFTKKQEGVGFKQLATESCPGSSSLTCYKYEETDGEDKSQKRVFWFDNRDFLLRQDEYTTGKTTTTNVYTYDNIVISEPSPTKEVKEGDNIFMYMLGQPTLKMESEGDSSSDSDTAGKKPDLDAMLKQAAEQLEKSDAEDVDFGY